MFGLSAALQQPNTPPSGRTCNIIIEIVATQCAEVGVAVKGNHIEPAILTTSAVRLDETCHGNTKTHGDQPTQNDPDEARDANGDRQPRFFVEHMVKAVPILSTSVQRKQHFDVREHFSAHEPQ